MKSKDILNLACKILSIVIFTRALISLSSSIVLISQPGAYQKVILLPLISLILISLFLWFKSDWISNIISEEENKEIVLNEIDYSMLFYLSLSFLGLYLIVDALPDLLKNIAVYLSVKNIRTFKMEGVNSLILKESIKFVIGLILLLNNNFKKYVSNELILKKTE